MDKAQIITVLASGGFALLAVVYVSNALFEVNTRLKRLEKAITNLENIILR